MGKITRMKAVILVVIALLLTLSQLVFAKDNLPSRNENHYADQENLLSEGTKTVIKSVNNELISNGKGEIVVVTTDSFEPYSDIEEYSTKLFEKWKIGSKERNDGLLIVVSSKERKSRIEVGYGLEGLLPDGKTGRFQDDYAIPYFKEGKYDEGIKNLFLNFAYEISPDLEKNYENETKELTPKSRIDSIIEGAGNALLGVILLIGLLIVIIVIALPLLILRFLILLLLIPIYIYYDNKKGGMKLIEYQYKFKAGSFIDRKIEKYILDDEKRFEYYSKKAISKKIIRGNKTFWSALLGFFNIMTGGSSDSGSGGSSGGSSGGGSSGGGSSGGGGSSRSW